MIGEIYIVIMRQKVPRSQIPCTLQRVVDIVAGMHLTIDSILLSHHNTSSGFTHTVYSSVTSLVAINLFMLTGIHLHLYSVHLWCSPEISLCSFIYTCLVSNIVNSCNAAEFNHENVRYYMSPFDTRETIL